MNFSCHIMKQKIWNRLIVGIASSLIAITNISVSQEYLPIYEEEVDTYLEEAKEMVLEEIECLLAIPDEQKAPFNVMRPWNQLGHKIVSHFGVLTFLSMTELPCKETALQAMADFRAFLQESLFDNPNLYHMLLMYAETFVGKDRLHTSYDHYQIESLLKHCKPAQANLLQKDQVLLDQLLEKNAKFEQAPFVFLKSHTQEKQTDTSDLTVLTLNTCFVPGNFPYLFGGVVEPWEERVARLAEKIIQADADVVCLQEVHAEDASYALFEELKDHYTYFYGAIGPRLMGFSIDTLGMPSGLFVASKYPLESPHFMLFSVSGFPMNYGCFDFIVKNGERSLAHVYTTHLQSLNYGPFAQIRALQLQEILEKMQRDLSVQTEEVPFFLCGDFNIPYGSDEPGLDLVRAYFEDDYNKDGGEIDAMRRTCTDYFTNYFLSPTKDPAQIDGNFQILDYALLLRRNPSSNQSICEGTEISTRPIFMNDLKEPESAISDHHGLFTTLHMK